MSVPTFVRGAAFVVAMLVLSQSLSGSASAQDKEGAKPAAKEGAEKEKADFKGTLPAYYRDVIDGLQREKMYAVQASYEAKIKEAQAALKALQDKRDAEIEALLRPDQLERVQQLKKEARAKQAPKGDAPKEQPKKEGAAKPEAK